MPESVNSSVESRSSEDVNSSSGDIDLVTGSNLSLARVVSQQDLVNSIHQFEEDHQEALDESKSVEMEVNMTEPEFLAPSSIEKITSLEPNILSESSESESDEHEATDDRSDENRNDEIGHLQISIVTYEESETASLVSKDHLSTILEENESWIETSASPSLEVLQEDSREDSSSYEKSESRSSIPLGHLTVLPEILVQQASFSKSEVSSFSGQKSETFQPSYNKEEPSSNLETRSDEYERFSPSASKHLLIVQESEALSSSVFEQNTDEIEFQEDQIPNQFESSVEEENHALLGLGHLGVNFSKQNTNSCLDVFYKILLSFYRHIYKNS